ncbi:MAG: hypothetical protein EA359_13550 [Balneolaceae bacterium]|nr:MAG: hypothetical protein EA359_13550 [Balneolaceae bacterium]
MKIIKKVIRFFIVFILVMTAGMGCSDSSNSPDLDNEDMGVGKAVVDVTGSITDEHTGAAFFTNPNHAFNILLGGHDDDDFDVDITKVDFDRGVSIPSAGTYSIGNLDSDDFRADYVNRGLGGRFFGDHHYTSDLAGGNGILVLESVSSNLITGSFEFTASLGALSDGTPVDPVTVSGTFSAVLDE